VALYSVQGVCYSMNGMYSIRLSRMILLILTVILSGVLIWVVLRGVERRPVLPSSAGLLTNADIKMERFSLKQIRNGLVEWEISADQAVVFEDKQEVSLKELQATLQTTEGLRVSFAGDRGVLNTGTHDFEIEKSDGNLEVSMNTGYTIQTPSLNWKDQQREIVSNQPVQIVAKGLRIRGNQLIVKMENQQLTVNGDVHVTTEP
jgi:LPS export ABC transporter protein LptC